MAGGHRERGMATAELALVVPAVVLVLALCLSGLGLAIDQVRCVDAAWVAARAASRGEPVEEVAAHASQGAPDGSRVSVTRRGQDVQVTVTAPYRRLRLPGLPAARATASAPVEPVVDG